MSLTKLKSNDGFTIVELLIALSILSVVLVTATVVLIQLGSLYSKGVNAADLQNATRNAVADISGQIQFSGKVPYPCTPDTVLAPPVTCYANKHDYANSDGTQETVYSYCIGNTRYNYVLNRELGTDPNAGATPHVTRHVLWRDVRPGSVAACDTLDLTLDTPSTDGYEMMGDHMRLTKFLIQQVSGSNVYGVDVWTAFGDDDLVHTDLATGRSTCSGGAGTQFCSVASITTQLTGRVY